MRDYARSPDAGILMREAMKSNHPLSRFERPKENSQRFETRLQRQVSVRKRFPTLSPQVEGEKCRWALV
jgi:hypothetical protein